ncbi:MAG: hypothetical protein ACR2H4_18755 [Pyrinomonadaceae bacterium]
METVSDRMTVYADGSIQFDQKAPEYVVGLDLGKSQDYTALCVLEMHENEADPNEVTYHCRHLERFKLGTSYPDQVARVRALCLREPLRSNKPRLAVDQTGVGAAVVDLFRRGELNADLRPILIHGGNETTNEHGVYHVPKRELVGHCQVALQTGRLKIAADLPEVSILTQELQNFEVSISESGFDSYEARTGKHDDLVLSLAMALWLAQKRRYWKMY